MEAEKTDLTIQEVAEQTGLSVHTLRYYERVGLIHPIDRAENSHRRYTSDDVGWIDFLLKLRRTGMTIQQMQHYTELQRAGEDTLLERLEMLKRHKRQVEAHIKQLRKNLEVIHYKVGYYQGVVDEMLGEKVKPSA